MTLADNSMNNFIVLLIDEAHEVTLKEWKWLLGLQNALDEDGYKFSVFSIGSHKISFQPDYIARTGNAHITARFFQ
jgi:type II secretory pathway predicted ATPase ExeA